MQKRKYTHMKHLDGLIESMRQGGMTLREIADELETEEGEIRRLIESIEQAEEE